MNKDIQYKILAFDIDGTLVDEEKNIRPRTKEAVLKAATAGCNIVIASGRPVNGVLRFAEELDLKNNNGFILALNGGVILSLKDNCIIKYATLPSEFYREIYELSKKYSVPLMTYDKEDVYGSFSFAKTVISEDIYDKYIQIEARINKLSCRQVPDLCKELDYPVTKFIMTGDGDYLAKVEPKIAEALSGKADVYRSAPFFLEIVPIGIDKAESLNYLAGSLGYTMDNVMAFGDGYNDVSMLEHVGMGIAMANGCDEARAAADYVTSSNEEDGCAEAIYKFVI